MKPLPLAIGAISLGLVVAVVVFEWHMMTSPGALHPSHFAVPELQGSAGCVACHGQDGQSMADACTACHQDVADQLVQGRGIHGSLDPAAGRACASCHAEHTHGKVRLVSERSFEQAGVSPAASYDHRFIPGFDLKGAHDRLRCEQCHVHAHAKALGGGQKRFLGTSQECRTCHEDVHKGEFGGDCASCHGQVHSFKDVAAFSHTTAFPLDNAHAGLKCQACHAGSGPHAVASLLKSPVPARACVSCHEDAHHGTLGHDCASCHGTSLPFNQAAEYRHTALFPLVGGHSGRACKECHDAAGPHSVASLQVSSLPVRECAECHHSPHRPELVVLAASAAGLSEASSCVTCHSTERASFLGPAATMPKELHKGSGFALDPPHDKVECAECHAEFGTREPLGAGRSLRERFVGVYPGRSPRDCAACHLDPHKGQFAAGASGGRCIECHAMSHFAPSMFDLAHHNASKFPLTGAHQAVACALCHQERDGARVFVPTSTSCASCHTDVHGGAFDGPGKPVAVEGKDGCARCHQTRSFGEVTWDGTAHAVWTGYHLKGAHAGATCVQCHGRAVEPDRRGRTLGVARRDCVSCHADPHGGQFARAGVTDCARCHTETRSFAQTLFDHNRDSSFRLDETHAKLNCQACHKPAGDASGRSVIRYRPLGSNCQDCHDPGVLRSKERPR